MDLPPPVRRSTRELVAGPHGPSRPGRGRAWLPVAVVAVLVVLVGTEHSVLARSLRALEHPHLGWLAAAVAVEATSMAALARMQRRILGAGGVTVSARATTAVVYASNAISGTVPIAGAEMGTAFAFRQYQRLGATKAVTAWMLLVSGVVSSLTFAVAVAASAFVSGNDAAVLAGAGGAAALTGVVVTLVVAWRNAAARDRMREVAVLAVRATQRLARRSTDDASSRVDAAIEQLSAYRLRGVDWVWVGGAGMLNWLADAVCLALAVRIVGAHVPWSAVGLVWAAGATAGTLRVTPGGVGTVEPAMVAALAAAGVGSALALTAVLAYRLVSFWGMVLVGWVIQAVGQLHPATAPPAPPLHTRAVAPPLPSPDLIGPATTPRRPCYACGPA